MADNVPITPGSGADIATDDVAGVQFQRIKITDGLADSTLPQRVLASNPLADTAGAVVRQAPADVWATSFSRVGTGLLETDRFTQRRLGTGMGVTQASGNLLVTTGTTANSEFLARSLDSWAGAMTARFKTILSQRIANNSFVMLLADSIGEGLACTINSATSITVTKVAHGFTAQNVGQAMYVGAITGANGVPGRYAIASVPTVDTITFTVAGWPASGSCTLDLFGWNYIRSAFSGTTATNLLIDAQRNGWNSGDTTVSVNTTASPGTVVQIYADGRNVAWSDALVASATTLNVTSRGSRIEAIPDDDVELYWYIWSFNGTTAPASTTTWTVGFVAVEDNANVPTYIAGVRPAGSVAPLPVVQASAGPTQPVSGTVTATVTGATIGAGTAAIGDVGQQYRSSATGAASGTHLVSAATTNATVAKASAGRLLGFVLTNNAAAKVYVKFHNQTTTPTAGTGVVRSFGIPAGGTITFALEGGIAFATGIAFTTVTGAADADTTAVAASDIVGDIFWS